MTVSISPRLALASTVVLSLLVISGCSGSSDAAPVASETTAETIAFDYADFDGTVPADPERVVVIEGRADLEFALSLGYPVVGSGFFFGREGLLFDEMEELIPADLATFDFAGNNEPDYEAIAALDPDLIIMRQNAYTADFYGVDRLEEIAPILALETGVADWQKVMRDQAEILQREDQVDAEIERYTDTVAEIKKRSGDDLAQMTLAWGTALADPGMFVITNSLGNAVASDLGITLPHFDPTDTEGYYEIAEENLDIVADVDTLAIHAFDERPALSESAAFARLPAVESGRVFSVDLTVNQGLARAATAIALELEKMALAE